MKTILTGILTLILFSQKGYTQADTIQNRMHYLLLQDSTEIQYEIGQITLYRPLGLAYLKFVDSTSSVSQYFLRTKPFHKSSTTDTIYFRRFANFDDKFAPIKYSQMISLTSNEQLDSITSSMKTHYANKEIYPNTSQFSSVSSVKYVVELRKYSNDAVLQLLDSLTVFRSDSGFLRYKVGCYEANVHKQKISTSIPIDTEIYLAVRVNLSLPYGSSYQEYGRGAYQQLAVDRRVLHIFKYQEFDDCSSEKKSIEFSGSNISLNDVDIISVDINNVISTGIIEPRIKTMNEGTVNIIVINALGVAVFEQSYNVAKGNNTIRIDPKGIPNGMYSLLLRNRKTTFSTKFIFSK